MKCNKCGKEISLGEKTAVEDVLIVSKNWGYFSNKDGENHRFILCEKCYDEYVETFVIPISKEENNELI